MQALSKVNIGAIKVAERLDELERCTYPWLLTLESTNSRKTYANDMGLRLILRPNLPDHLEPRPDGIGWLPFLLERGVDPFRVTRVHVDAWVENMRTGRDGAHPVAKKTVARRLSTLSSWYEYLLTLGQIPVNPVKVVKRPRVDPDFSPTFGPDRDQARAVMRAAVAHSRTAETLVSLLLHSGLRTTEAVGILIENLTVERGHRVVRITGKGDEDAFVPLSAPTAAAVDGLLERRAEKRGVPVAELEGPLLEDQNGRPMTRQAAADLIGRLGRHANLPRLLTPHGLRHAFVTLALDAGVSLRRVQDSARHKDPRTTRRYDRRRNVLDEHAAYAVAAYLAE